LAAAQAGEKFLLRIENFDQIRAREEWPILGIEDAA
jgi:hypothetical protein